MSKGVVMGSSNLKLEYGQLTVRRESRIYGRTVADK